MEKARVKEKNKRGAPFSLSLSLSFSLSMRLCSARVSSFSREVVFPPCQSVCCIRVFYISPVVFPQLFFFSLINLGF